jgi:DNA-binding response OmpR family regulator
MNDGIGVGAGPKPSARILIVEDEPLIAENLRADLGDAGFEIVGIAARVEKALTFIDNIAFDIAIVDANLAGRSAAPVAAALSKRSLPFVVLSGYAAEQLQKEFAGAVFVQKKYLIYQLIRELDKNVRR